MTNSNVLDIFTFCDHFFKIVRLVDGDATKFEIEDEYDTKAALENPADLREVRGVCVTILQRYRAERSMPGAQP
jgi:hypothetical protein